MLSKPKRSKYGNVRVQLWGHSFDSKGEAARYWELAQMEKAGDISSLQVHYKFDLGVCKYEADFCYRDRQGSLVVEDYKSKPTRTAAYRIKKKLMKERYGVEITEVTGISSAAKAAVNYELNKLEITK